MDLVEISPDLKILVGKCYVSRSVRVFSGFGEKIRDRTNQIGFWKKRPTADRQISQVGWRSVRFRSNLPGGSSWRLSWTPLINTMLQFLDIYRYRCELHSELIHYFEKEKEEGKLQCLK